MVTNTRIYTKDYIEVVPGEIYNVIAYLYNFDLDSGITVYLAFYDADKLDIFENLPVAPLYSGSGAWKKISGPILIPEEAVYARVYVNGADSGTGAYMFMDNVSLKKIDIANLAAEYDRLIWVNNETTKHTVVGDEFFTGIWKEAEYYFDLTSFTETGAANPVTIDVKIQTYDYETDTWRDAMVFQQKSCGAGGSVTTSEYKRLASNLGWKQRVSYTTAGAGTIGDCDFKVGVVYKR